MNDLIGRLAGLPFAPMITWASGTNKWLGIGLGDLLLAAVFPLVMRRHSDARQGSRALALGLATLKAMVLLLDLRAVAHYAPSDGGTRAVDGGAVRVLESPAWRGAHNMAIPAGRTSAP